MRLIAVLAVSQIFGWGMSFDMPSVLGRSMARDLNLPFEVIFMGLTVMMMTSAFLAPRIGQLLTTHGARRILSTGSGLLGVGLFALAQSQGPVSYFAAWLIIGAGGAFALSVPAYTAVVEQQGSQAKRTIATLMIFTGLSSAVCWPLFSFGETYLGWRGALLAAAFFQVAALLPLHFFGLPSVPASSLLENSGVETDAPPPLDPGQRRKAFLLLALGSSLFSLVSFGISASLIELMKLAGAAPQLALTLASFRAVIGISARFADLVAGHRISPVTSALVASLLLASGFFLLAASPPSSFAAALFILFYGAGGGIAAVARAVLPLAFFSRAEYALMASRAAFAQNIGSALSPTLFASVMEYTGLYGVLYLAFALSLLAVSIMVWLWHLAWTLKSSVKPP